MGDDLHVHATQSGLLLTIARKTVENSFPIFYDRMPKLLLQLYLTTDLPFTTLHCILFYLLNVYCYYMKNFKNFCAFKYFRQSCGLVRPEKQINLEWSNEG